MPMKIIATKIPNWGDTPPDAEFGKAAREPALLREQRSQCDARDPQWAMQMALWRGRQPEAGRLRWDNRFPGASLLTVHRVRTIPHCIAHCGRGRRTDFAVRAKGLARRAACRTRHQGGVHPSRNFRRDDFHRHPFVVRTGFSRALDLDAEIEEAAASLGANRWQTVSKVILAELDPGAADRICTGLRARRGEYGSVILHCRQSAECVRNRALLIVIPACRNFVMRRKRAIAVVMLGASFLIIFAVNRIQRGRKPESLRN